MFKFLENYKKKRSYLKSLVALIRLRVSYDEYTYLLSIGNNVGVSKDTIETMLNRTKNVKSTQPLSIYDKIDYVYDIATMALADGILDEDDIEYGISISEKLGITQPILVRMVFLLVDEKKTKIEVLEKLKSHLLI